MEGDDNANDHAEVRNVKEGLKNRHSCVTYKALRATKISLSTFSMVPNVEGRREQAPYKGIPGSNILSLESSIPDLRAMISELI